MNVGFYCPVHHENLPEFRMAGSYSQKRYIIFLIMKTSSVLTMPNTIFIIKIQNIFLEIYLTVNTNVILGFILCVKSM